MKIEDTVFFASVQEGGHPFSAEKSNLFASYFFFNQDHILLQLVSI